VRLIDFPDKPSRFNATFSCESVDIIRCFHGHHRPNDFIYEVDLVDPAAPTHKGDFNAVESLPRRTETYDQMAVKYWRYSLKTNGC
jgi:hypothetical protein